MLRMVLKSSTISTRLGCVARMQISTSLRASSAVAGLLSMPSTRSTRAVPLGADTNSNGVDFISRAAAINSVRSSAGNPLSSTQISTSPFASNSVAAVGFGAAKWIGNDAITAARRHSS